MVEAADAQRDLADLPEPGLALLDAALELAADNFGAATAHLDRALDAGLDRDGWDFHDDLLRLLRLAYARGYGEKLIGHFERASQTANLPPLAERMAPVYAALVAFVRGERHLLNFNPEVRGPATTIYRALVAPLRNAERRRAARARQDASRPSAEAARAQRLSRRRHRPCSAADSAYYLILYRTRDGASWPGCPASAPLPAAGAPPRFQPVLIRSCRGATWMAGTSPAMTTVSDYCVGIPIQARPAAGRDDTPHCHAAAAAYWR